MCDPSMPYFSFIVSLMLLCWQLGNSIIIIITIVLYMLCPMIIYIRFTSKLRM